MDSDLVPVPQGFFQKNAWAKFNAKACLRILADEREAYAGLKQVLYAGICAWMIAPQNSKLIKSALALATLTTLANAEKEALAGGWPRTIAADIIARSTILGPEFIEEIYYPIGGAIGLARAPSIKEFKLEIASGFPRIEYAISIIKIYHHHVTHLLGQPRYGKPSLNKAAELITELDIKHGDHKTPTKSRYLKDAWAQNRDTIALIYAASKTKAGDKNLLQKITLCQNNYKNDAYRIPLFLGKAKFISEKILSKCADYDLSDHTEIMLPNNIESNELPPPDFSEEQHEIIRRKFSRSAV